MEKDRFETSKSVHIAKSAFEGLEFIRRSGATNMLDRSLVLNLARAWDLNETAAWIESVDPEAYRQLILKGPDVIGDETLDEKLERTDRAYDEERKAFWEGTE